jgi:hypothetical protein
MEPEVSLPCSQKHVVVLNHILNLSEMAVLIYLSQMCKTTTFLIYLRLDRFFYIISFLINFFVASFLPSVLSVNIPYIADPNFYDFNHIILFGLTVSLKHEAGLSFHKAGQSRSPKFASALHTL